MWILNTSGAEREGTLTDERSSGNTPTTQTETLLPGDASQAVTRTQRNSGATTYESVIIHKQNIRRKRKSGVETTACVRAHNSEVRGKKENST